MVCPEKYGTRADNYGKYKERVVFMTQEVRDYVIEKTKELINAPSCSKEAKDAANARLAAAGTEKEAEETAKYLAELEEDIMPVDSLIAFANSEMGARVFGGEEAAKGVAAHGEAIKAAGANYCDCPACAAAEAILKKKEALLA